MQKEIICTECANRCHLLVEQQGDEIIVKGNRCPRLSSILGANLLD